MHCLWCDTAIIPEISWETIILLSKPKNLCTTCEGDLTFLRGNRCVKCSRTTDEEICPDCKWRKLSVPHEDPLTYNYSIFAYNEAIKEMISRWKYRGDYSLGEAFRTYYRKAFERTLSFLPKETVVVPIPLSEQRMHERGFNQSKMLADFLPLETGALLERTHSEKQSKKTRRQRITAINPFQMNKTINNTVILADDIYTTGTTLRHAAFILKRQGCPAVYALTLIRG